jgi:hypothetical protein
VSVRTFARESIFQHILEIPFKQSGLLGKILLDRPRRPQIFGDDRNFDQE